MDPATWIRKQAKKLLLLHPPRQAPPPKQTLGENSSGNWCACSFFKQNRAQYKLSLSWDVINSPEAASSYWTQCQHWFVVWLSNTCPRGVIRGFNSFNIFFSQSERVITVIRCFSKRKTCGRRIIISITSLNPVTIITPVTGIHYHCNVMIVSWRETKCVLLSLWHYYATIMPLSFFL